MFTNIALVGTGGMGTVHYNNYSHIDKAKVVCLVGKTPNNIKKSKDWNLPIFENIADIDKSLNVDIIDICVPTYLHYDYIIEALNNNYSVICEKPLVLKYSQALYIESLLKEKKQLLYIGQVVQFSKETKILRDLIEEETYGKVLDGYFERLSEKPDWVSNNWLFDKSKSGLLPFDLHIHDLDLIISLFGEPSSYYYTISSRSQNDPEHFRFSYEYPNFNIGAECAWFRAKIPFTARWRLYFEKALLVFDGKSLVAYETNKIKNFNITEDILIETGINLPPTGMFYRELSHFIECFRLGKESPYSNINNNKEVIKLLESFN